MDNTGLPDATGWEILFLDVLIGLVAIMLVSALIVRASRYPGPARYIGPLAILSGVSIVLGAVAEQDALIAIGAGGVGALGAVLQAVTKAADKDDDLGG